MERFAPCFCFCRTFEQGWECLAGKCTDGAMLVAVKGLFLGLTPLGPVFGIQNRAVSAESCMMIVLSGSSPLLASEQG